MPRLIRTMLFAAFVTACAATPEDWSPSRDFVVEPVAERVLAELPVGELHWRIEVFPTLAEAQAAAGPTALTAEVSGRSYLFTLAAHGERTPGGAFVAEIGPVPRVHATRYLLRINHAHAPPGAATTVHRHPGSEAFYVIAGQLSQRTEHGVARVDAGDAMNGHAPGMVMQLRSTGTAPLDQIVLFVVDPDRPFSSPATFEAR